MSSPENKTKQVERKGSDGRKKRQKHKAGSPMDTTVVHTETTKGEVC